MLRIDDDLIPLDATESKLMSGSGDNAFRRQTEKLRKLNGWFPALPGFLPSGLAGMTPSNHEARTPERIACEL